MPLPKPKDSDTMDSFVSRFMGDESAQNEFADHTQRLAVATDIWTRFQEKTIDQANEMVNKARHGYSRS